ncbi:MAG: hypothetical protein AAGD10_12655 [Myxococcota bacterium]
MGIHSAEAISVGIRSTGTGPVGAGTPPPGSPGGGRCASALTNSALGPYCPTFRNKAEPTDTRRSFASP